MAICLLDVTVDYFSKIRVQAQKTVQELHEVGHKLHLMSVLMKCLTMFFLVKHQHVFRVG